MVNPFYRQTHNIFKIFKISTSTQISKDGGFVLLEYFYSSGGKNSEKTGVHIWGYQVSNIF